MLKKTVKNAGISSLAMFCVATSALGAYDDYYSYTQAPVPVATPASYGLTDSGFVIGVGGGYANTHWDNINFNGFSVSPDGFAAQVFVGYDFNKYFGLQGGYAYLPKATSDAYGFQATNYALDLLAKLSVPVTSGFSIYALAGGSYLNSNVSVNSSLYSYGDSGNRSHFGPAFGVGAAYEIVPNFAIGVDWMRYSGQGKIDSSNYQPSPDAVFFNLSYKFPANIS